MTAARRETLTGQRTPFSPSTLAIFKCVHKTPGLTALEIAKRVDFARTEDVSIVQRLSALVKRGHLLIDRITSGRATYRISLRGLRVIKPDAQPSDEGLLTAKRTAHGQKHTSVASGVKAVGKDPYQGAELAPFDSRPGAMDAFSKPSRVGSTLRWRDGRVTDLSGNAITPRGTK